jgi:hypothetical protein
MGLTVVMLQPSYRGAGLRPNSGMKDLHFVNPCSFVKWPSLETTPLFHPESQQSNSAFPRVTIIQPRLKLPAHQLSPAPPTACIPLSAPKRFSFKTKLFRFNPKSLLVPIPPSPKQATNPDHLGTLHLWPPSSGRRQMDSNLRAANGSDMPRAGPPQGVPGVFSYYQLVTLLFNMVCLTVALLNRCRV